MESDRKKFTSGTFSGTIFNARGGRKKEKGIPEGRFSVPMSDEKSLALESLAAAIGEIVAVELNRLKPEHRQFIADRIADGSREIRLFVVPDPLTVLGALHDTSERKEKPIPLFRLPRNYPDAEEFH